VFIRVHPWLFDPVFIRVHPWLFDPVFIRVHPWLFDPVFIRVHPWLFDPWSSVERNAGNATVVLCFVGKLPGGNNDD